MINIADGESLVLKIRGCHFDKKNKLKYAVTFTRKGDLLWLEYGFSDLLRENFKKCFSGTTWHGYKVPSIKQWSISYNLHNLFQMDFLSGGTPYEIYDKTIKAIEQQNYTFPFTRPLKQHQKDLTYHWTQVKRGIWAADMGLGKSLSAIEATEFIKPTKVFWVSINSGLISVRLEYKKWNATIPTTFLTYDGLKKLLTTIPEGWIPPQVVIFDESQKVKTISTQRTEAAIYLVNLMREFWGDSAYILLMSGTPSPKSPLDWYSQCEIAQPGYLREGNIHIFKERLAIVEKRESAAGGVYPELLSWRDDNTKCDICGKTKEEGLHDRDFNLNAHTFVKSVNEVEHLYNRMRGLVIVKTKKECLDLPEKVYQKIQCKPSLKMMQAMKMIMARAPSAIQALTLCRELSDGFQYTKEVVGKQECPLCYGDKTYSQLKYVGPEKTKDFLISLGYQNEINLVDSLEDVIIESFKHPQYFSEELQPCPNCNGKGEVDAYARETKSVDTAKDQALRDLLDEHEEYGRIVIYAGFTASVDKCVEMVGKKDWQAIRVDGRGWHCSIGGVDKAEGMIDIFQNYKKAYSKLAFIGHPSSASTGLTLTASPTIVHYSNTFKAEDRMQADDRIHRIGMDENLGARIIDLIHLPSDQYVLDNLMKKRRLQDMSIGQLITAVDKPVDREYDYE